jgi:hypothetical protein
MSIFNQPIHANISSSLDIRQKLMGKENRTTQELVFLNSNTSWVKLSSSVNYLGTSNLAKSNILTGGSLYYKPENSKGAEDWYQRAGVTSGDSGAYSLFTSKNNQNILGIRPMPGITSVKVSNIGAYGSIRKAEVNFQCWDVKQLEELELLYMRPGYTVLLEFGRNNYLEYNNNIPKLKNIDNSSNNFFERKDIVLLEYVNELYKKSIDSKGNYDAFFGYITNYGWSARNDGGYECRAEILSMGETLESLKINYSLGSLINLSQLKEPVLDYSKVDFKGLFMPKIFNKILDYNIKTLNKEYSENILSGILYEIYTACYTKDNNPDFIKENEVLGAPSYLFIDDNEFIEYAIAPYMSNTNDNFYINNDHKQVYITLNSFCKLVNKYILPKIYSSTNNKSDFVAISTNDREYINGKDPLLCLYNSLAISTNPDTCWVNNPNWVDIISGINIEQKQIPIESLEYNKYITIDNKPIEETKLLYFQNLLINQINLLIGGTKNNTIIKNIREFKNSNYSSLNDINFVNLLSQVYSTIRGGEINIMGKRSHLFQGFDGSNLVKLRSKPIYATSNFGNLLISFNPFEGLTNFKGNTVPDKLGPLLQMSFNNGSLEALLQKQADVYVEVKNIEKTNEENKNALSELSNQYFKFNGYFNAGFKYSNTDNPNISKSSFGQIGNIYINLKYLYILSKNPQLQGLDQSENNSLNLSLYIKEMLRGIQTSLGNFNNFEFHIDPIDNIGRIIDLNYINKNENNIFTFNMGDNKSIIRNLQFESKIFSNQSNMISISAQSEPSKMGYNNSTFLDYNKDITDRMIIKKDIVYQSDENKAVINYISSLSVLVTDYLKNLLLGNNEEKTRFDMGRGVWTDEIVTKKSTPNFNDSAALSYSNVLRDIISFISSTSLFTVDNQDKAFLPTQISFTLDGLSGFIIGNVFKIDNTFVPNYYKRKDNNLGYVITNIDHDITNDWTTTIKGFPFIIDSNNKEIKDITDFTLVVTTDLNTGGSVIEVQANQNAKSVNQYNQSNIKQAVQFFFRNGFKDYQIAALVGGFIQESKMEPSIVNSIGAVGIAQWLDYTNPKTGKKSPRKTKLKQKNNWQLLEVQLNYVIEEFNGDEKNAGNRLKNSNTLEEAIAAASSYERYKGISVGDGVTWNEVLTAPETGSRISFAKDILNKIQGGTYR